MTYRIGLNMDDVNVNGDNLYGDGVNVANSLGTIAARAGCACGARFTRR